MPLTIKRTNSTSIETNSVLFNGTSRYLRVANNAVLIPGLLDFTIEGWVNLTSYSDLNFLYSKGVDSSDAASIGFGVYITTGKLWATFNADNIIITGATTLSLNTWYHIAITRQSNIVRMWLNGVQDSTNTTVSNNISTTTEVRIGRGRGTSTNYFNGYISNFRFVRGTALYTSTFDPSTVPLTAIANTQLLTCQSATIIDNSQNNFAITNNGSSTVSSFSPFATPSTNNFQFARRSSTLSGKSVQFDGTNDYLSLADSANLRIGTSAFCIEAWIYLNTLPVKSIIFGKRTYNTTGTGTYYFLINSNGDLQLQELQNVSTIVNATAAIQINTWYHVAVSRDASNTVRLFVNGSIVSTATSTFNFSSTQPLWIGKDNAAVQLLLNGYISNLRFVIGNPVYTSSFAPSTAPLTAIANTALLTCNADTIVDSSTNNFTITNNNGATVSSVSPFVASGGGMSLKKVFADPVVFMGTQKAIFGYGYNNTIVLSMTNLVSNTGVVATDTTGVGTARTGVAATGYGTDKAIFGYGYTSVGVSMTNLVSNTGVVATDISGVGTARGYLGAAKYGADKAIFVYGYTNPPTVAYSISNLVSNTGVVSTDTVGVGTARYGTAQASYGNDKAIFGYGWNGSTDYSVTNLVSNTGVVATDTTGVGTARHYLAATSYGTDKAIFGYGLSGAVTAVTNLVSNTGVVATDTTGVGTARSGLAGSGYGTDKGIFGYGTTGTLTAITNLVSNTGVVATDTAGVGTARQYLAAAGYSLT